MYDMATALSKDVVDELMLQGATGTAAAPEAERAPERPEPEGAMQ